MTAGRSCFFGFGLMLLLATASAAGDDLFSDLEFRHIGPIGNRVPAVVGVRGDPKTYYAGAASGGIFKTTDGGAHWDPIFDDTPASSIGSLAVAPSDPAVVWAGTGETFIRSNVSIGNGIYRSTDAGKTWEHRGLQASGRIGRIVIHPTDSHRVYAAALGHLYGPQDERGIYRTIDGGNTWERVLFVDRDTGAIDLVMDPGNPRILFAATWQMVMSTAGRTSGGPGSGIYTSRDGGDNWTKLEGRGLPNPPWGKIGLAMSADNSDRIYALIETSSNHEFEEVDDFQGVLWRSDDGGDSWAMVSADNTLTQRPLYYTRAVAAPDDHNEITFMAVQQSISHDGGKSIEAQNSGWDHHDLWIDPLDPDRRIAGHDGGVSITLNRGKSWFKPQLPIAQIYRVHTDNRVPYWVYGNRQDGPSAMGPSNTLTGSEIPVGAWRTVGGCEVGSAIPDPSDPDVVWSGCYDGILERHNLASGQSRDVSIWPLAIESWPGHELRYRIQWTAPLALSPHDPKTVYYGSQYVHRTQDGGQSWEEISPDLTTNDPKLAARTGGLTLDDAGPTVAPVVFAIAESSLEPGVIWAGTNDGQVQVTRNHGADWSNVTSNLPDLPALGTISSIEPSRHAKGQAYLTIDRHQEGDTGTHVFRTRDYGKSWTSLRSNLPQSVFGYAHILREDPVVPGLLFLGTENALWVSFDGGQNWESLQSNLPPVPVYSLTIQEFFGDLVLATYGRGFWILDDITPLRQLAAARDSDTPVLFAPRPAYRFRRRAPNWSEPDSGAAGQNPDYGATLHFYLAADTESEVELVLRNTEGEEVRRLEDLPTGAGLHRSIWNLRAETTPQIKLRTRPEENAKIPIPEKGWRPLRDGGRFSLLVSPGIYSVDLEIGTEVVGSQSLVVKKDPSSLVSDQDLVDQMSVLADLETKIEQAATIINELESMRSEILVLQQARARIGREDDNELLDQLGQLETTMKEIEGVFFDLRLTGARQDTLRWKRLLYSRLTYLARRIAQSDQRPTDAQFGVYAELSTEMEHVTERYRTLVDRDLPAFNQKAADAGWGVVALAEPDSVPKELLEESD